MSPQSPANRVRTIDLGHEQMLVIEDRPGTRIDVLVGGVWLTEERRWQDRFAMAGDAVSLQARGRAVLEAIGPTRLRLVESTRRAGTWWRLRARRGWLQPQAARAIAAALAVVAGVGLPELLGRSLHAGAAAAPAPQLQGSMAPTPPPGPVCRASAIA